MAEISLSNIQVSIGVCENEYKACHRIKSVYLNTSAKVSQNEKCFYFSNCFLSITN